MLESQTFRCRLFRQTQFFKCMGICFKKDNCKDYHKMDCEIVLKGLLLMFCTDPLSHIVTKDGVNYIQTSLIKLPSLA